MWSSIQKGQGQGQGYRGIEQVVRFLVPVMVDICVWGGDSNQSIFKYRSVSR